MNVSYLIKQKGYEKVVFNLRRHPITFLPTVFLFAVLLSAPAAIYLMINNLFPDLLNGPIFYPLAALMGNVFCLSILLFFYSQFVDFYLDLWIVTNDRIIDIEQHGLFSRSISEVDLFRIQDVTTDVHGFFATLFKYGNVTVTTASANTGIIFRNVHQPNKIRGALIQLSEEDRKHHVAEG